MLTWSSELLSRKLPIFYPLEWMWVSIVTIRLLFYLRECPHG